jgi:hypothetical protein
MAPVKELKSGKSHRHVSTSRCAPPRDPSCRPLSKSCLCMMTKQHKKKERISKVLGKLLRGELSPVLQVADSAEQQPRSSRNRERAA